MPGGVYPGGISRQELEQRFRQLHNQLRSVSREEIRSYLQVVQSQAAASGEGLKPYTHNQNLAAITWEVKHNLGRYPLVSVLDSAGTQVHGGVKHISKNELQITFSAAFKGTAQLV